MSEIEGEALGEDENDHRHQELGNDRRLERKEIFDLEAGIIHGRNASQAPDWRTILKLSFQCIGVVYGDLGTSPLYVLAGIFPDGIKHRDDLMGVVSLIAYAIIFIALIKYVFVVLAANDNGDEPLYWPQFVLAVLAAIIASQSLISALFSIVQQAVALGCFPRVKVVRTSTKYGGQVYVPEINYFLMLACVAVTLGFKNTLTIGNAYGIAVAFVFVITSSFLVLVMVMIWKAHIILIALYILSILLLIELKSDTSMRWIVRI